MKKTLITIFFILVSANSFADPITDYLFDKDYNFEKIQEYMAEHPVNEEGSLPTVSSFFKNSKGRIQGASFTLDLSVNGEEKKLLITNAHLIEGSDKEINYDTVFYNRTESEIIKINDQDVTVCADQDIAVIDLSRSSGHEKYPSFAKYVYGGKIITKGMNNSPRGYYLMDNYGEAWPYQNQNKKPLFENTYTNEILNFIQMGNMYDLSCNYFPSSPEHYDGNAIFIPINSRIKNFTKTPAPFVQKIFNRVNSLFVHQERVRNGTCRTELSGELKNENRVKTSHFSENLVIPAGIVPGMSGSPLVVNNDLRQDQYEIIGMVSSYNRRMQQSYFISAKHIKACIDKVLNPNDIENKNVKFKYSSKVNSLYRSDEQFIEIPLDSGSAGHFFSGDGAAGNGGDGAAGNGGDGAAGNGGDGAAGNGGDGAAGNGGDGAAGNGGDGAAGNGGDGAAGNGGDGAAGNGGDRNLGTPQSGMIYNGIHVLGFSCLIKSEKVNVFANWEYRSLPKSIKNECSPISIDSDLSLDKLLEAKFDKKKIVNEATSNNNLHSLKLKASISLLKDRRIKVDIKGEYYLKELDDEIGFKDSFIIENSLSQFNPYHEIKITKQNITNFFNKYEGGETLVLDFKELFFINLEQISKTENSVENVLLKNNKPKLYGSLKYKNEAKGSIPVELLWRK